MGFFPGLNFVASGIDAISAKIDASQGQYGDAAFRGGMAALGVVPGLGSVGKLAGKALGGAAKGYGAMRMAKGVAAMRAARSDPTARTAARTMFEKGKKIQKIGAEYTAGLQANQYRLPKFIGGRGVVPAGSAERAGYGKNFFQSENPLSRGRGAFVGPTARMQGARMDMKNLYRGLGKAALYGSIGYGLYKGGKAAHDHFVDPKKEDKYFDRPHYTTQKSKSNTSGSGSAFNINQADEGQTQSTGEKFRNKF